MADEKPPEVDPLDKLQTDKAHEVFAGVVWPKDPSENSEALRTDLDTRAEKFLTWRKGVDVKLPSIRQGHFPHYCGFAACMVHSSRASLAMWTRRLLAGKAVKTPEEERAKKIAKVRKLVDQLKALGQDLGDMVDIEALIGKIPDEPDDAPDDEAPHETEAKRETAPGPVPVVQVPTPVPPAAEPGRIPVAPTVAPAVVVPEPAPAVVPGPTPGSVPSAPVVPTPAEKPAVKFEPKGEAGEESVDFS